MALRGKELSYCWGWGNDAVVATEADIAPNKPAPVFGSSGLVLKSVATGLAYACGLTATGEVYCWGANKYGQLGNGSTEESETGPRLTAALMPTTWLRIATRSFRCHRCP